LIDLQNYLEEKKERVDAFLRSQFQTDEPHFRRLFEAVRYSLLAGGKRIRPVLAFAAFEAVSDVSAQPADAVLRVAAAIEMIHTYSLIHDDLPAMDNDDLRRGRPTNHKVYGEATAILAGDCLLTEAFLLIARAEAVPAVILLDIIKDIAEASGGNGMAGGQAIDLEYEGRKISAEELEFLHRHKTGCLIEVSVVSGAKLAGAEGSRLAAIKTYGQSIGLAFQIADDILDVEGGSEEMGKATGGDAKKEKATYPSILGLEKSKTLATNLAKRAVEALQGFDRRADPLREIARYIVSRRK
jgi:geranylgeranyl diphosphate synthase type II